MNNYEALFLVKAKLEEKAANALFEQIKDVMVKNEGEIISARLWAENRSLYFPIKKKREATYYLVNFKLNPLLIDKIKQAFHLNEDILRVLITRSIPAASRQPAPSKKE
jgi:ribosomal protein S6